MSQLRFIPLDTDECHPGPERFQPITIIESGSSMTSWFLATPCLSTATILRVQRITRLSTSPQISESLDQYRKVQKYFYGDFYPLTEYTQAEDAWIADQFDLPDSREGLDRRYPASVQPVCPGAFPFHALEVTSSYGITNLDTGEERTMSGKGTVRQRSESATAGTT